MTAYRFQDACKFKVQVAGARKSDDGEGGRERKNGEERGMGVDVV